MYNSLIIDSLTVANKTIETISNTSEQYNNSIEWMDALKISIPILIAFIAGFVALVQVKLNVISNARIRWNENLRDTLSEYITMASYSVTALRNVNYYKEEYTKAQKNGEKELALKELKERREEWYMNYVNANNKSNILGDKSIMYLNSSEEYHKKIEDAIKEIVEYMDNTEFEKISNRDIQPILENIRDYSKIIFKKEWKKSKKIFNFL